MNISEFYRTDCCNYGSYDNYRKIASMVDGLKPSGRKCIYTVLKYNVNTPKKVAQLKSKAAEETNYLHGDDALAGVIVGLAQNFTGSNNLPLLQREGAFGSRLIPEAAAPRYIFTCKEPYLDKIFRSEDEKILIEQEFEGDIIEPKYYVPVIPLLVVNGSKGISTGFSQNILPHNVDEVIKYLECKLTGKKFTGKMLPYFNGFTGDITVNKSKDNIGSYCIIGKYNKINANKIEITEVPTDYTLESYLKELDKLEASKKIKDYHDLSENSQFKIEVTFWRNQEQGLSVDSKNLLSELKLISPVTENYTSMDQNNKIVEYNSIFEILDSFYDIRLEYYNKRKKYLVKTLTSKILEMFSKYLFIKGVIDKSIIISNKDDESIIKQLEKVDKIIKINDSYDYLLNMPMKSITKTHYEKLKENIKSLKNELTELKNKKIEDIWLDDLNDLKNALKKNKKGN